MPLKVSQLPVSIMEHPIAGNEATAIQEKHETNVKDGTRVKTVTKVK